MRKELEKESIKGGEVEKRKVLKERPMVDLECDPAEPSLLLLKIEIKITYNAPKSKF